MDVNRTFINGNLEEVVHMKQSLSFEQSVRLVCKPKKALYGLKQAL